MSYKEPFTISITEDKVIDILLHAATREDIQNARIEVNTNIQNVKTELSDRIQSVKNELDISIQSVKTELIHITDKLEKRVDKLENKLDRMMWGIIVSILMPIALHYMK